VTNVVQALIARASILKKSKVKYYQHKLTGDFTLNTSTHFATFYIPEYARVHCNQQNHHYHHAPSKLKYNQAIGPFFSMETVHHFQQH